MVKPNALQAVLDRAKASVEPVESSAPLPDRVTPEPIAKQSSSTRQGTKLIGGHFAPEVSTQLRIIAAEESTTVQSLLAEALDDLFVKKGRIRVTRGV